MNGREKKKRKVLISTHGGRKRKGGRGEDRIRQNRSDNEGKEGCERRKNAEIREKLKEMKERRRNAETTEKWKK